MSQKTHRWSLATIFSVAVFLLLFGGLLPAHKAAAIGGTIPPVVHAPYSFKVTVIVTLTSPATVADAPSTNSITVTGLNQNTQTAAQTDTTGKTVTYVSPVFSGNALSAQDSFKACDTVLNQCTSFTEPGTNNVTIKGSTSGPGDGTASGGSADNSPTCESDGLSLAWIICPVINALADAVDGTYNYIIQPLLVTKPISFSNNQASCSTNANNCIYKIWSNFRVYADIFLIIALLVVVFGQSIGGGIIDAYSAKKILPRLLAAAILINLSIYIVALAIDVTNIVGQGIQQLLTLPFQNTGAYNLTINGGTASVLGIGALVTGAGGVATVWAAAGSTAFLFPLLQFLLLFILLPAFLIFISILATIILRQGLIILLVVVSPVAFALYCLPNTEQYFRRWWDLFFRTLLVYPIIAVLFGIANILAVAISEAAKSQGGVLATLSQLMAIIAMLIPLFLVPFSFRIAGGLIGRFQEFASNATGRIRQSGFMQRQRQQSAANLRRQTAGSQARALSGFSKTSAGRALTGIPGLGRRFGASAARAEQRVSMLAAESLRDPRLAPVANDEFALKAGMFTSYGQAVNQLQSRWGLSQADAEAAAQRWQATGLGYSQSSQITAFQAAVADGTVFKDTREEYQMVADIAGQNDSLRERVWGSAYAGNKAAGRGEMSASYGTGRDLIRKLAYNEEVSETDFIAATVEGVRNMSNTDVARMKGMGMKNSADALTQSVRIEGAIIDNSSSTPEQVSNARVRLAQSVAKLENMRDTGAYMPEGLLTVLHERGLMPSERSINIVHEEASPRLPVTDASGAVVHGPPQGPPLTQPNPDHNPAVAEEYGRQRLAGNSGSIRPGTPGSPEAPEPPRPPGTDDQ